MAVASVLAQAPANYYIQCEGKSGKALLQALCDVIGPHTTVSYDGLYNVYRTSDVHPDGTLWDMYSTKNWGKYDNAKRCGNYSVIGDCFNREHSFPKSWFNDKSPMYSDAYHLYPTDGKVNGQRSNFPYGECANGTQVSPNGSVKALGRLGNSTFPGYSGTVFEPDDEYKGDFARTYFYMAACYNDLIAGWSSPMLAGNNYPAYKTWAVNLLMKWHAQDPVSEKEINRNNAVSAYQKNRNPFIDHPELADHIWGSKQSIAWTSSGTGVVDPTITVPTEGETYDIGITGPGVERSVIIPVKGVGITAPVQVTVAGSGFSATATSIAADVVNSGRGALAVYFRSTTPGNAQGVVTFKAGNATVVKVNVKASVVTYLPALPATDISETSFMAHWVNIDGDGATYTFDLKTGGASVTGYPLSVPAEDECLPVTDLEPGTLYTYTLSSSSKTSPAVEVKTATPIPSIQFLYDGELNFVANVGEPSEVAELLLDIENVPGNITVSVDEPFSVSTDRASWNTTATLVPGEDRVYLRLMGNEVGKFSTSLRAIYGDYVNDETTIMGIIRDPSVKFIEEFELPGVPSYGKGTYVGTAGSWIFTDMGWFEEDKGVDGTHCMRWGKSASSSIATAAPLETGAGTVTFAAMPWSGDEDCKVDVQTSTDATEWTTVGTVAISGTKFETYTVTANRSGSQYVRLLQTSGKRLLLDNLEIAPCTGSGVDAISYHSWDAFCLNGNLVIENKAASQAFQVYGIDGISRFDATLSAGAHTVALPAGLYIVVQNDFARRVVVK